MAQNKDVLSQQQVERQNMLFKTGFRTSERCSAVPANVCCRTAWMSLLRHCFDAGEQIAFALSEATPAAAVTATRAPLARRLRHAVRRCALPTSGTRYACLSCHIQRSLADLSCTRRMGRIFRPGFWLGFARQRLQGDARVKAGRAGNPRAVDRQGTRSLGWMAQHMSGLDTKGRPFAVTWNLVYPHIYTPPDT